MTGLAHLVGDVVSWVVIIGGIAALWWLSRHPEPTDPDHHPEP